MNAIEPNLPALAWFGCFWSLCCLGFLQIAGLYPLDHGAAGKPRLLAIGSSILWLGLVAGTSVFAWAELRLTSVIVLGGLLILFIPALFQSAPRRWRDSVHGLVVGALALCLALVALCGVESAQFGGRW
jgi:hypothetical protein